MKAGDDQPRAIGTRRRSTTEKEINMRNRKRDRWTAVVVAMAAGGLWNTLALADADGKKDVTWQFVSARGAAGIVGNWSSYARAGATCQHGNDGPHETAAGANGHGTWNATAAFASPWITDSAAVPHASSDAKIQMSAGAAFVQPGGIAPQGFTRYNAVLSKDWAIKTKALPDVGGSSSWGRVHGHSSLNAGSALKYQLTGNLDGVAIRMREGKGDGGGVHVVKDNGTHTARWRDPIDIRLINDSTGESITEELFRFDIDADFADNSASWSIANNMLTIAAGAGASNSWLGSISVIGAAKSSWLVNPLGDFSVSLSGGLFSAGGFWANLWNVTTDSNGKAVSATVNLSDLNLDLQYTIPDALMNDTDSYTRELHIDEDYQEQASASDVPAPATLAILGLGLVIGRNRPRR